MNYEERESCNKVKLGIARCLLGESVRYDGSQKLDRYLRDILGQYVEWVPVCPEVECGMSIPREAVRLVGDLDSPRLVGRSSGKDWTAQMYDWGQKRLDQLEREGICGYVFRFGSPSNGMNRVKVYNDGNRVRHDGIGMWARMVMERFPGLPFEDDGRLHDPALRENFISRFFTLKRWRDAMSDGFTAGALVEFHTRHKLLIMAHNVQLYRAMGKIVAKAGIEEPELLFAEYFEMLFKALTYKLTVKKHINVLMHAFGYFKKDLSADEKQEMLELLDQFSKGLIPLIAPIILLNHYVRKYSKDYLAKQYYLNPYPAELMLRNHV
ncbi:DUF523 and DUF1722 domain-containing protein [Maridesulfovibrio ferrireducens]|uniref:YbgA family protein n=1 Tax=Maridesulfovibrio ferrireducens TaxID=246191 RepID=UPI001A298108|nr:DUF523 and DUF1722 domain-containing protein [Maridesulfovibrio ferrireducens]MBI9111919.1 DUF523 and DUF1722 domain-containing protein [Maridesulfovibrio ferrireducens]